MSHKSFSTPTSKLTPCSHMITPNSSKCSDGVASLNLSQSNAELNAPSSTDTSKTNTPKQERESAVVMSSSPNPPTLFELSRHFKFNNRNTYSAPDQDSMISFTFSSNCFNGVRRGLDTWSAVLMVYAPDVPRLMRERFHWSSKNIVPEYNGFIYVCKWRAHDLMDSHGKPHKSGSLYENRRYLLTDLTEENRWTACIKSLRQYASDIPVSTYGPYLEKPLFMYRSAGRLYDLQS